VRHARRLALLAAVALGACAHGRGARGELLELVECAPVETTLDHTDLPDAHAVWLAMIGRARTSLDFGQFYAANAAGSRLEPIVQAVEAAADRGVRVRFLFDARYAAMMPDTVARLERRRGVEVRRLDVEGINGGNLHAKYFLVDGEEAFLGSQNFDWRSLTHIQELGVRLRAPALAAALAELFEADWARAGGAAPPAPRPRRFPVAVGDLRVTPVFSPKGLLPDEALWELPRLVALLDGARRSVRVQLLTYKADVPELDAALRAAAARGVAVELLVSDWNQEQGKIEGLQALARVPNLAVRLVTIPAWSGGHVPYARVIHAKYLVVDGARAWLGTSNWEMDYFSKDRNAGLVVEGAAFAGRLDAFFADLWQSPYARPIDPGATYRPPRIE